MIQRGKPPRKGQWSIPGGAQHAGETLQETAKREVLEEVSLAINVGGFIEALDYIDRDANGAVRHHYTLIDFWARGSLDDQPKAAEDATAAQWFPIDALDSLSMWSETKRIIKKAAELIQ